VAPFDKKQHAASIGKAMDSDFVLNMVQGISAEPAAETKPAPSDPLCIKSADPTPPRPNQIVVAAKFI
jgi:hypothetical protein